MELVDALHRSVSRNHPGRLKLRQFKVTAISAGPPSTVTIDDRGQSIPDNRHLSSYNPAINDVVWALVDNDTDILVLGNLNPPSGGSTEHNHTGVYSPVSHTHSYAPTTHTHTGAGARFLETTSQSVASDTVVLIGWNSTDYSYGAVSERPSIATTGNITLPPGVWNISCYARLAGTGSVTRYQNAVNVNGSAIAVIEFPVNTGTNQGVASTTFRNTSNANVTVEVFQNSGNTKNVHALSNLSIDRLATV